MTGSMRCNCGRLVPYGETCDCSSAAALKAIAKHKKAMKILTKCQIAFEEGGISAAADELLKNVSIQ